MKALTRTEREIYDFVSIGWSAKDIAYHKESSEHTVRKHISNIKKKIGYYKSAELTAEYYCRKMGTSLEEVKKMVLAGTMTVTYSCVSLPAIELIRTSSQTVRANIELIRSSVRARREDTFFLSPTQITALA